MHWFPRRGSWEGEQTRPPSTAREAQGNFLPKWSLTSKGRLSGDYLSTGSRLAGCATCTQGRNHLLLSLLKKKSNKNNPTLYFLYEGDRVHFQHRAEEGLVSLLPLLQPNPSQVKSPFGRAGPLWNLRILMNGQNSLSFPPRLDANSLFYDPGSHSCAHLHRLMHSQKVSTL